MEAGRGSEGDHHFVAQSVDWSHSCAVVFGVCRIALGLAAARKLPAFLQDGKLKRKIKPSHRLTGWALDGVWHMQLVDALGVDSDPGRKRTKT